MVVGLEPEVEGGASRLDGPTWFEMEVDVEPQVGGGE